MSGAVDVAAGNVDTAEERKGAELRTPTPNPDLWETFKSLWMRDKFDPIFPLRKPGVFVRCWMTLEGTRIGEGRLVEAVENMCQERTRSHEHTAKRTD